MHRLTAPNEFLGVLTHALLKRFSGLWRRQKAFIGAARPVKADREGLLIGLIHVDDRAIRNIRFSRPAGFIPIRKKFAISRCRVGTGIDQKIAGIDRVARAKLEKSLRIAAHHP